MEYSFFTVSSRKVNELLDREAVNGWTVHTINRNPGASIVDILLQRSINKASTGPR